MPRRRVRPSRLLLQSLEARDVPSASLPANTPEYLPDRIVVRMADGRIPRSPLMRHADSLGNGLFSVDLRRGVGVARGLANFNSTKGVLYAEPDYVVRADLTPNDSSFGSLWGLNNTGQTGGTPDADIDAPEAWDVSTGGGSIPIGIIDTGVDYRHPDLYKNIWINQAEIPAAVRANLTDLNGDGQYTFYELNDPVNEGPGKITDLNGNGYIDAGDILAPAASGGWADGVNAGENGFTDDLVGWDFVNNDNNPLDDNNHGTHVSGTIGAMGNNGIGVAGINWQAQIAGLKFLNASGSGSTSGAVAALNYAVAAGLKVTNNSWGGGGFSQALSDAITAAQNAGQIFVAAAGNSATNNDSTPNYPSNYPQSNVVAVGSSTSTDARSSFSSYGATTVDLFAPGSSILSTTANGTYSTFSGTSMATPHVTGSIALVWDAHPAWSAQQVIDAIKNTVDQKPAFQGLCVTGGRLNVNQALRYGSVVDQAGPVVTASAFSGTGNTISGVRFTFNEAIDGTSVGLDDVVFTDPNGFNIPVDNVSAVSATEVDVAFPAQSAVGTYTMVIGPGITDLAQNPMNQNGSAPNGEIPGDQYTATRTINSSQTFDSTDVNKLIADRTRTTSVLKIGQNISIKDLNVTLDLNHTWDRDLRITLVAPDGTQVLLVNRRGGSGDNFKVTTLDSAAATAVSAASAPFNGTFRPEQSLSAFNGKSALGTWTLVIDDLARSDTGWINAWSLTVQS